MVSSPTPAQSVLNLDDATATRWFWIFTIGHVLIWTIATAVMMPNVTLDDSEMIYWGHEWQWGYYKHPPLAGWLAEAFYVLTGNSVWGVFFAARLSTGICFWAVWALGRKIVPAGTALLAVIALEAAYFFTHEGHDLNNNVAPRCFWALAILALFVGVFEKRFWAWVAAGACLGVAMLGKYDAAVLALVMLTYSVCDSRGRQAWRTAGPYAMLATALLVFAPHFLWLMQNDYCTILYFHERYTWLAERSVVTTTHFNHITFPLEFLVTQVGICLPVVGVCALSLLRGKPRRELDDEGQARRRFLLMMAAGPAVGFFLISLILGARLQPNWGHMLATWLPLTIFAFWETDTSRQRAQVVLRWGLAAGAVFVAVGLVRSFAYPHFMHKGMSRHFPGREVARQVEARWHEHSATPLSIVGGDPWIAANIGMYSRERPSVYCKLSSYCSPWVTDELLNERGGVIVWSDDSAEAELVRASLERYPAAREVEPAVAGWLTSAPLAPVSIHVVIVPPAGGGIAPPAAQLATPGGERIR